MLVLAVSICYEQASRARRYLLYCGEKVQTSFPPLVPSHNRLHLQFLHVRAPSVRDDLVCRDELCSPRANVHLLHIARGACLHPETMCHVRDDLPAFSDGGGGGSAADILLHVVQGLQL